MLLEVVLLVLLVLVVVLLRRSRVITQLHFVLYLLLLFLLILLNLMDSFEVTNDLFNHFGNDVRPLTIRTVCLLYLNRYCGHTFRPWTRPIWYSHPVMLTVVRYYRDRHAWRRVRRYGELQLQER